MRRINCSLLLRKVIFGSALMATFCCPANINPHQLETTMQTHFGLSGIKRLSAWEQLLSDNQTKSPREKLELTNHFFNTQIRFEDDLLIWKQNDYWATPLETMGKGAGDCEDYTIAKYVTLINLGTPIDQLRLIYVKAQIGGPSSHTYQAHMVLGYYEQPDAIPLILDSLINEIETADKRDDLHPVFSFNSAGLWVGNQAQPQIDPTARLSRWRDVLERMKQEGF